MAENKILPWAQTSTANALSDADYASDVATGGSYADGVKSGQASSKQANKTWRQATAPGAGLGQFLVDNLSVDVTDADTPSTFSTRIANAVLKLAQVSPFNQAWASATGGYRKYAIVSDSSGNFWVSTADQNTTTPGVSGAKWQDLFAGYATNEALNTEITNRTNADTHLQNQINNRVLKTGDNMTGHLRNTDWISAGVNGGWNGARTNTGDYSWTNGIEVGNPANNNAYRASMQVTDVYLDGGANTAGINFTGYDAGNNTYQWYLAWNGNIQTPKGLVAFESDISQTTHSGNAGDAGSYTITVYTDPSTPNGKRYRISGQTAAFTGEGRQTISLPLTLNGILPGAWGATTFWNVNTSTVANDQFAQIIGAPTVSSITVNMAVTSDSSMTWPCYATWWVEGY